MPQPLPDGWPIGWDLEIDELSYGHYRAKTKDILGRSAELHGSEPDELTDDLRRWIMSLPDVSTLQDRKKT